MNAAFFSILVACGIYGILHSLLASLTVKHWFGRWLGAGGMRYYRLIFNLVGGLTALPLFYLVWRLPNAELYQIPFPWVLVTLALQLAAGLGLLVGVGQTGAFAFLGLDAFFSRRRPRLSAGTWKPGLPTETSKLHSPRLVTGGLYRWVRHPLYACGLLILWLAPSMSTNLLALNLGLTVYILVGIQFEERRLLKEFGPAYKIYRRQTPMLIPFFKK